MPAWTFGRNLVPILFLTLRLKERVVEGRCWIVANKTNITNIDVQCCRVRS